MKRRIHYDSRVGDNTVCGRPVQSVRRTDERRSVTCKQCQSWLRLVYPRTRALPLIKRKIHYYNLGTETPSARCGMRNHRGLITGKMDNVTCGRCLRLI